MQNLVVFLYIGCAHVRGPGNLGDAGARPLEMGVWLTSRNTFLPHLCYCTKFGQ